jgi:hypothetical protein
MVRVAVTGQPFSIARLRDVSASGAFVMTAVNVPYMVTVQVRLLVRRNHRVAGSTLQGVVVRRGPDGIGIEWLEFCPAGLRHLTQPSGTSSAGNAPESTWHHSSVVEHARFQESAAPTFASLRTRSRSHPRT